MDHLEEIRRANLEIESLTLKKNRALSEARKDIAEAEKFSKDLSKETDEKKILSMINEDDVKKSMFFDLDEL